MPTEPSPSGAAAPDPVDAEKARLARIDARLARRLGPVHARQRIRFEEAHEAQAFGQGLNFFHVENWYSVHAMMRLALRLAGVYGRGRRNAAKLVVRRNEIASPRLPAAFDNYVVLHLSDLHADMSGEAMARAREIVAGLAYDVCVITGDFRARTFGGFDAALDCMTPLVSALKQPVYGVLGNHDTIRMVPALEDLGVRMLLNESTQIFRGGESISLAGVDDAHFFRMDNLEKAAADVPPEAFSLLLSHTPEIYAQAAHAGFDAMLSGHTHGGQICLPGGVPITLDSNLPRRYGAGAWRYCGMSGYTSVGTGSSVLPVRFNCPPEIALHRLRRREP